MAKLALLIGVSEYELGLNPLPAARRDAEALKRVLEHPKMGGFDDVKLLVNPNRQTMEDEIESLFSRCKREDLTVLFFSGHGIKDSRGRLYLSTCITRKNPRGDLVRSSAVSTRFVHDIMDNSRCKRQAIILDCCFSGAFDPSLQSKNDGSIDLRQQLGAQGRVVLASSSSTEYSFEQVEAELSIYTRYLVEGIETGAGGSIDKDFISAHELHEYAATKVKETAPNMTPKMITLRDEGFDIILAKVRINDPKLQYRKEVSRYTDSGTIRPSGRYFLDEKKRQLAITDDEAVEIEVNVLRPYRERMANLKKYRAALVAESEHKYPLEKAALEDMKRLQDILGLKNENVISIQQSVEDEFGQRIAAYRHNLTEYERALKETAQRTFPLDQATRQQLDSLRESLGLKKQDTEQLLIEQAELRQKEKLVQRKEEKEQKKNQEYKDSTQTDHDKADRNPEPDSFYNIFESPLKDADKSKVLAPRRGDNLRLNLRLSFEEAVFGNEKEVRISHLETCKVCGGLCFESGESRYTCSSCNGTGQIKKKTENVFGLFNRTQVCSSCNGSGTETDDNQKGCKRCHDKGRRRVNKKLNITVPAGVENGTRLRVSGEGDAGLYGGVSGDLYIYLVVKSDKKFRREGIDIYSTVTISPSEAFNGCQAIVDTIDNKRVKVEIPSRIESGTKLRLSGIGVPQLSNPTIRGDHFITVNIQ